ncbi:MAG TPA: OmpA family protein [Kofleriaceae bacterium]|nr:OmpA family protein [Kofleriaceae bacterium]
MKRLAVALVAVVGMSTVAQAGVEIGGTAGLHMFSESNSLGTPNTMIHQANSAMFGLRFGFYFSSMLGLELEGGLIPTESAGSNVVFDIYDATARANLVAQFRTSDSANTIIPFVLVGGGETRVIKIGTSDDSLFKKDDMRGSVYLGAGAKYRAGGGWGVRVDVRGIFVHDNTGAAFTNDVEILASLYREWGRKKTVKVEDKPKTGADGDSDGIEDATDKCPTEAEDKDDFQDDDGCPDKDNDADGVADDTDKCKGEAEDKDNYQDDDGCPELDNDSDGVPDASDKCATEAETKNGFDDEDGCPDEVPPELTKVIGPITGVSFKANSADLAPASNKALDAVAATLAKFPTVKVEIGAHSDDQALKAGGKFADNDALTAAQAEAVKAYLVQKGAAEGQITVKGYGSTKPMNDPAGLKGAKLAAARKINRRVELTLVVPEPASTPTETKPVETPTAPPAEGGAKTEEPKLP